MEAFFVTAPKGMEDLLADELNTLGALDLKLTVAGVSFRASWEVAYNTLLWSRLASRLLFPIASFEASTPEQLYAGVAAVDWSLHMKLESSFLIDANLTQSVLTHSRFVAQHCKDAIVDQFRDRTGCRPNVARELPDLRLNVHIRRDWVSLAIDLSGAALSNRGYRKFQGDAPLRENLAAAILLRAGWPAIAAEGGALIDPMCGSGTLLIEGLMMASQMAPGLLRQRFGVHGWLSFDEPLWARLYKDALSRHETGLAKMGACRVLACGFDRDMSVIDKAHANAALAGLSQWIQLGKRDLTHWKPANTRGWKKGLLVVNPPYGSRIGDLAELPSLYQSLGRVLCDSFKNWQVSVFTGNPQLGKRLGIRAKKRFKLFNGPLACELLNFEVSDQWLIRHGGLLQSKGAHSEGANAFRNRLKKNIKALKKWVRQEDLSAYRVYDADMPEYNVAVDRYGEVVIVSEYAPPAEIAVARAEQRLQDVLLVVPEVMGIDPDRMALKRRRRQKGQDRYEPTEHRGELVPVKEAGLRFLINPFDYLDVGLFNDHRPIRGRIRELARGKRFLNLFAYTGSATVAAAAGDARSTATVDLSHSYLEWAQRNMAENGFEHNKHRFFRNDCQLWVQRERGQYDLIFLDPPTFSNSKSFDGTFEVQRDHVAMITGVCRLLAPNGLLIFSNNYRRFKIDEAGINQQGLVVKDITADTIPMDFARNKRIHQCYEIQLDN